MKNVLLIVLIWLGMVSSIYGVRSTPYPIEYVQPDGSKLTIKLVGDERFAYTTTTDGYVVIKDRDGFYKYAPSASSVLPAVRMPIARNKAERTPEDLNFLKNINTQEEGYLPKRGYSSKDVLSSEQIDGIKRLAGRKISAKATVAQKPVRYLVILASFSDKPMTHLRGDFDNLLNQQGYSANGGTGSVRDYYMESSLGQFVPNFDVVGPVVLPQTSYYYGHDTNELDPNAPEMIYDACLAAKAANPSLNFADYDLDGDKIVDNVYVIFAGYSQAGSGDGDLVWPHAFNLNPKLTIDGVQVFKYACSSELVGYQGSQMDGVGTFAHEFGHVVGLLDMYDTDGYNNGLSFDPGPYSIMASGSYNNQSRTPPTFSAIERLILGWGDVEVMKSAQDVELAHILTSNKAYAIDTNPIVEGESVLFKERFYLENRQKKGWDSYLPGHGMLIFHVDMTPGAIETYFMSNAINARSRHRCIYIKSADGKDSESTRAGDPYPGTSGNTAFTDTSYPSALSWSSQASQAPVTNIREENGMIYFQFKGGVIKRPEVRTYRVEQISNNAATLKGEVIANTTQIIEQGFCWSTAQTPTLSDNKIVVSNSSGSFSHSLTALSPFTKYYVRSFARYGSDQLAYGPILSFWTDCSTQSSPYTTTFKDWSDGTPDCWMIVDANNDGVTWSYDDVTGAVSYMASLSDAANDWLISPRIKVPERGSLSYIRGLIEERAVEQMEVWVSTKSRDLSDFVKVDARSLDDNYFMQQPEAVDLSAFSGREVYVALVATSERASYGIWILGAYITTRLDPVRLTSIEPACDGLFAQWEPVVGAKNYFTEVWTESSRKDTLLTVLNESHFLPVPDGVTIGSGVVQFKKSATIQTKLFNEPILAFGFLSEGSGPSGVSTIRVEGSDDGANWVRVGPDVKIEKSMEQNQHILSNYINGKGFRQLRFTCTHGGRNVKLLGMSMMYTDGYQREYIDASSDTTGIVTHKLITGLTPGKRYSLAVYASDKMLYYDSANTLSAVAPTTITTATFKGESGGGWNDLNNWTCLPCLSTDVTIPADKNVVVPLRERALYKSLTIEANDSISGSVSVYGSAVQKKITFKRKFDQPELFATFSLPFGSYFSSAVDEYGKKVEAGQDIQFYEMDPVTASLSVFAPSGVIAANKALFVKPLRAMTLSISSSALGVNPSFATSKSVTTQAGWSFNGLPVYGSVVLNPGYQSHSQGALFQFDAISQLYRLHTLGDGSELKPLTPVVTYNAQPGSIVLSPTASLGDSYPSRYGWYPLSLSSVQGEDRCVVAMYQDGVDGVDGWDTPKLFSPASSPAHIFTEVDQRPMAINSMSYSPTRKVSLYIESGDQSMLTLSFDPKVAVGRVISMRLKDLKTQHTHDLLGSGYTFSVEPGVRECRFELDIESESSAVESESLSPIYIEPRGKDLLVRGICQGDYIRLYSPMGQLILEDHSSGSELYLRVAAEYRFLLVQIRSASGDITTLKYIGASK